MPTSAIISGLRSVVYFGGSGLGHPLLVLFAWSGVALLVVIAVDVLHVSELRQTAAPSPQVYAKSAVEHLRARRQRRRLVPSTGDPASPS
jgi:hypothetical protein